MALIELKDIKKIYSLGEVDVSALAGVSLDIEKGEYVSLVGPSGSNTASSPLIISLSLCRAH